MVVIEKSDHFEWIWIFDIWNERMQNGARDQQLTKFWLPYGAHMDEYIYLIFLYKIPESRPFILNKASIKSEVLINGSICNFYEWKWISLLAQYTSITFVFFFIACLLKESRRDSKKWMDTTTRIGIIC